MISYQERKLNKQFDLNKTEKHTLTFIFPPLYSCSAWGSRARRRENSEPSMSSQSSAWPSSVMSSGFNSARTRISESDLQLHLPDSSCELTQPIETVLKTKSNSKSRSIAAYEWPSTARLFEVVDGCFVSVQCAQQPILDPRINSQLTFIVLFSILRITCTMQQVKNCYQQRMNGLHICQTVVMS